MNNLFFLKFTKKMDEKYIYEIYPSENRYLQTISFCSISDSVFFHTPLRKEYPFYFKNRVNLRKIIKSRILVDNSDTGFLPVVFPEKPAHSSVFPENAVKLYCDGCLNRYGTGGWAFLLESNEISVHSGSETDSDSCRMELYAVIRGLESIKQKKVIVHTDSRYVKHGTEAWLPVWELNNYTTASNKPAKNSDLWKRLSKLKYEKEIYWKWIKSGSGNFMHNCCHNEAKKVADYYCRHLMATSMEHL